MIYSHHISRHLPSLVVAFIIAIVSVIPAHAADDMIVPEGVKVLETPRRLDAGFGFMAPDESNHFLMDYRGKYILINLWATWCPPCIAEMPSLDNLQKKLGPEGLVIIPLSMGEDSLIELWDFFDKLEIQYLMPFIPHNDREAKLLFPDVRGLPTTMLIDPNGNEIAVMEGDFVWDSPEMVEFLHSYLDTLPQAKN